MMDWRGTKIEEGVTIVYPGRQSSSMWMIEAIVLEVTTQQHWNLEIPALRVQPIKTGRFGDRSLRPVTITALERVTVIKECEKESNLMTMVSEGILNA
jgi:hypothetical protein